MRPRRGKDAGSGGPCRKDLKPALKEDPRPQLSAQTVPVLASHEAESVTRNRCAEDAVRARIDLAVAREPTVQSMPGLTQVGDLLRVIRCTTQHNGAMDRTAAETWVAGYERLWRTPGTDRLSELFVPDASYLPSPWAQPIQGLDAIATFWESERKGPDEEFTMTSDVVTVDGRTAVVRVLVSYGVAESKDWRDLWVLTFASDGRCSSFEEWPFAPDQPDGH